MRSATLFLFLAGACLAQPTDLDRLEACIGSVRARQAALRARVPAFLFSTQGRFSEFSAGLRKLQHMHDGLGLIETNRQALVSRGLENPLNRIMAANALEECLVFETKTANLAWYLQTFLGFFSLLCTFLTLRIVLAIFTAFGALNGTLSVARPRQNGQEDGRKE